jgi:hypothetical protein
MTIPTHSYDHRDYEIVVSQTPPYSQAAIYLTQPNLPPVDRQLVPIRAANVKGRWIWRCGALTRPTLAAPIKLPLLKRRNSTLRGTGSVRGLILVRSKAPADHPHRAAPWQILTQQPSSQRQFRRAGSFSFGYFPPLEPRRSWGLSCKITFSNELCTSK